MKASSPNIGMSPLDTLWASVAAGEFPTSGITARLSPSGTSLDCVADTHEAAALTERQTGLSVEVEAVIGVSAKAELLPANDVNAEDGLTCALVNVVNIDLLHPSCEILETRLTAGIGCNVGKKGEAGMARLCSFS